MMTSQMTPKRRWLAAGAVVVTIMLLGTLPELFTERRGTAARLIYLASEAPIVIVALSFHFEWAARNRVKAKWSLAMSLTLAGVIGMLAAFAGFHVIRALGIEMDPRDRHVTIARVLSFGLLSGLLQCGIWALGFVYPFAAEDARLRTLEADKLRAAAELAILRSQLEPHFLLNTLNTIAGLVTQRPKEARRLIGCLGDLLRDSLRDPEEMQTLEEELTWLRLYAQILESRHAGALLFHWEVSDDARGILVPRLLLQPLVENAVNHGALQRSGGGEVTVRIGVASEHVVCTIEDNGPGMSDKEPRSGAFGLRSVRRRLELKYDDASLSLESTAAGTRSIVRLPRMAS